VGHDWGGALGMDWAAPHASRVRGIAVIETFLRPVRWNETAPAEGLAEADSRGPEAQVLADEMRLSCTQAMLQCLEPQLRQFRPVRSAVKNRAT
jgi:pimeloyl-ACP methyl ester carboxylesterase